MPALSLEFDYVEGSSTFAVFGYEITGTVENPPFMITFPGTGLSYSSLTQQIEVHISLGQQGIKLPENNSSTALKNLLIFLQ